MNPLDSNVGQSRPEIETLKAILALSKLPSGRSLPQEESVSVDHHSAALLYFNPVQKKLHRWYRKFSEKHRPILTQ